MDIDLNNSYFIGNSKLWESHRLPSVCLQGFLFLVPRVFSAPTSMRYSPYAFTYGGYKFTTNKTVQVFCPNNTPVQ